MKKHLIAVLIAVVMCLSVLSGCSLMRSFEKDVTVVAKDGSFVLKTGVVNSFNSMIMPTRKADGQSLEDSAESGYYFAGWATVENWREGEEGCDENQFFGKEYITYEDVKEVATDGSVILYPAYKIKVNYFFVFGYYAWTSTSGLDETIMQPIAEDVEAYLYEQYSNEIDAFLQLDPDHNKVFEMRGYNPGSNSIGGAGDMVNKDGDVGVFFGGGDNMNSTGKMFCYARTSRNADDSYSDNYNNSCIRIGGKSSRVAGLLQNDEVSISVYNWFQNYVKENIDEEFTVNEVTLADLPTKPAEEEKEPEEETSGDYILHYTFAENDAYTVNIGWYALTGTSGLDDTYVKSVEGALNEALAAAITESGVAATVTVKFTALCKDTENTAVRFMVDEIQNANADEDESNHINIVLGAGNNLTSTAGEVSKTTISAAAKFKFGKMGTSTSDRYVHLLNDTGLNRVVFEWLTHSKTAATAFVTSTPVA